MKYNLSIYRKCKRYAFSTPKYDLTIYNENLDIIYQVSADTLKVVTDEKGNKQLHCLYKDCMVNLIYLNNIDVIKYDTDMDSLNLSSNLDIDKDILEFRIILDDKIEEFLYDRCDI